MKKSLLLGVAPIFLLTQPFAVAQDAIDSTPAEVSTETSETVDNVSRQNVIVVTARRKEERITDVPLTMSAYSGEELADKGIQSAVDLTVTTPGIRIFQGAQKSILSISMRGQSLASLDGNLDASVGYYVDGIYVSKLAGANTALVDIERVELLKGPQGTLFGRNTPAGAMVIETADPVINEAIYKGKLTVGSDDYQSEEITLNLPLVEDKLALRLAGKITDSDGWGYNPTRGVSQATDNNWVGRLKLRATPTENIDAVIGYERVEIDEMSGPQRLVEVTSRLSGYFNLVAEPGDDISNYIGVDRFAEYGEYPTTTDSAVETITGTVDVTTDVADIKAIVGYRSTDVALGLDLDHTPYDIMDSTATYNFDQWSAELQFSGDALENRLAYTTGVYYFHEEGTAAGPTETLPLLNPAAPAFATEVYDTDAYSVFGQGTYTFTDQWSMTAGLRYGHDSKGVTASAKSAWQTPNESCAIGPAVLPDDDVCAAPFEQTDDALLYLLSLEYRPTEDILTYAKVANGRRSGGTNSRATGNNPDSFAPFDPEKVTSFEIGAKSELLDGRLQANLALYYDDYAPIQRSVTFYDDVTGRLNGRVSSAAEGRIQGIEIDFRYFATDNLVLGGFLGTTDAEYTEFMDEGVDRSDERFPFTPEYTWGLNGSYTADVGPGELSFRADLFHTGDVVSNARQIREGTLDFLTIDSYELVNARLSYALDNGISFALYGTNVLDQAYDSTAGDFGLGVARAAGAPRRIFAEMAFSF